MERVQIDWLELDSGKELAGAVCELVDRLRSDQAGRIDRMRRAVSRYEMRELTGLNPDALLEDTPRDPTRLDLAYPLERSLVDTVHADTTRVRLMPRILTSGADWQTQRKAKRLEKFLIGQCHQEQGPYANAWDSFDAAWRDAEICGEGYVHVFADFGRRRVAVERLHPWEVFVDPEESRYGWPQTLCTSYNVDKRKLVSTYVDGNPDLSDDEREDMRQSIRAASGDSETYSRAVRASEQALVREIWRLPIDEETPGRHAIVTDNCTLFEEEWDEDCFPIISLRWAPHIMGWGGTGLAEEAGVISDALNHVLLRIIDGYRIRAGRRVYYPRGSVDAGDIASNDTETWLEYDGAQPPIESVVPPLAPGEIEFAQFIKSLGYESTGVGSQSATAERQPGVNSGRAMRTLSMLTSARQAPKGRQRENGFKQMLHAMVRSVQELAEDSPKLLSKWPGQEHLKEIDWRKAEIDQDLYVMEVTVESSSATEVAGRTAALEEGMAAGYVSPQSFQRLTAGTLDMESESRYLQSERQYVEDLIDRYLDAEPDDPDFEFENPEPFLMDKASAMALFVQAYFEARRLRAPEFNCELLRRWIVGLDEMVKAAAAPPPGGPGVPPEAGAPAPPPPGPGGMPLLPMGA